VLGIEADVELSGSEMSETDLEAEAEEHARLTADLPPLDENEISDEQLLREIDAINEEVNSA